MQSIKSYGFESLEREILAKQVKTISSRLNRHWTYEGEGKDADLVLVKEPAQLSPQAVQVLVGKQPNHSLPFLESPVRMMQLATLLEEYTKPTESIIDAIHQLFANTKHGSFVIPCKLGPVGFNTVEKKISTKQRSLSTLIKNLSATDNDHLNLKRAKPEPDNFTWEYSATYQSVIWHLAKYEGQHSRLDFAANNNFKLAYWPRVTEWDPSPINFKLATLFSRQYLAVNQAAQVCKVSEDDVRLFLFCCRSCGVKVLNKTNTETKAPAKRRAVNDQQSLGWLRRKIKAVFNYGH